ncbi:ABC transporter substrate-binding protein [Bifidobacterium biavatii]|uniref:ABC transporter substrate-binding protein n=1 Tax=Bifidobacterium biavatii DSM 23969 TaxID=1437608 RepID=A0A086ZLU0_9BIFI|nr:extracellular solute-binding protein [Bifidobacterium biavatii]KFI47490.1 ABC transporter substrate-binding protein [Bifidobacterium biavatii DSM 23969]
MNKFAKFATILIAGALTVGSLAGCGTSTAKSESSNEILLWGQQTGPDAENAKKTFDAYNATNPKYKVKFVTMKKDTFNAKLATAGRSGKDVPDLAIVASEEVPSWHSQNLLVDWGSSLDGSKVTADAYIPSAWEAGQADGKQYGIPSIIGSWIMYYNKDLVDKYVPGALDDNIVTFDEIEKAGAAAKADGVYSYANSWGFQNYDNLYLQMGGKWLGSNGKISVNNDTSKKVFEEFQKLYKNGWMVPNGEDVTKTFLNGKLVFMPEGSWSLANIKKASFNWGETVVPQWDAKHLVQCSGADQFVIIRSKAARSEEKMKGMVDFMSWMQNNQLEMVRSGANPSSVAMLDNEEYTKMPQSFLLKDENIRKAINIITTPGLSYVNSEIDNRNWDMIEGKADIAQTMDEIQQVAEQKMK